MKLLFCAAYLALALTLTPPLVPSVGKLPFTTVAFVLDDDVWTFARRRRRNHFAGRVII